MTLSSKIKKNFFGFSLVVAVALSFFVLMPEDKLVAQEDLPKISYGDPLPSNLFIELARVINPTVVNISTTQAPQQLPQRRRLPYGRDPFMDMLEQFMGGMQMQQIPAQSLGTGFIIRADGLILTNAHVIEQADIIKVQLSENSKELYEAEVIGKDLKTDVALIKIDAKKKLPFARLGSSENLQVGEWVAAVGNPYGHGHSVTKGIVSAIGRQLDEINLNPFIQTDASINPGNSGGPLVNSQGLVIGVNTAIDARAQGIGFAIPIDYVKAIIPDLESKGRIDRGFLGIAMADIDERAAKELGLKTHKGSIVQQVIPESPAEKAGLEPYDFITSIDGKSISSSNDLVNSIQRKTAGTKVKVGFVREGKEKNLTVTLASQTQQEPLARNSNRKSYQGQKAPFDLGFRSADYSDKLAEEFHIPPLKRGQPIVIDVQPGSPASKAGLAPGDVILDVNKQPVFKARDLIKKLKKNATNILRVLKQDRVVLLYLRA